MDTSRADVSDVTWDLLQTLVTDALCRETGRVSSGWRALTDALRYAAQSYSTQSRATGASSHVVDPHLINLTEQELRQRLVTVYTMQRNEGAVRAIITAKRRDELSLLNRLNFKSCNEALKYWEWYLLCLTYSSDTLASLTDEQSDLIVAVPLDKVDLQVVAHLFNVHITLSQWMNESVRYRPPNRPWNRIHLLHHDGTWTHLLSNRPADWEPLQIEGGVVELTDAMPPPLELASGRIAAVNRYDSTWDAYEVVLGYANFLVERCQINRVIFSRLELDEDFREELMLAIREQGKGASRRSFVTGKGPPHEAHQARWRDNFSGVPHDSLEFQVIHELVRRIARGRLERMQQELSGRGTISASATSVVPAKGSYPRLEPLPNPGSMAAIAAAASSKGDQLSSHLNDMSGPTVVVKAPPARVPSSCAPAAAMPPQPQATSSSNDPRVQRQINLSQAQQLLSSGWRIPVIAMSHFVPNGEHQLQVQNGDEIWLEKDSDNWFWASRASTEVAAWGWVPKFNMAVWKACRGFAPQRDWPNAERYLGMNQGQYIVVVSVYSGEWQGWGFGHHMGDPSRRGIFKMEALQAILMLSREPTQQ